MFNNLRQLFKPKEPKQSAFDKIVGYPDIKLLLSKYLATEEGNNDINVLLLGSPATSKTLFMKCIQSLFKDSKYYDMTNTTGRGFIRSMINDVKGKKQTVLLLDEIEKIKPKSDLAMLLGLLEDEEVHYVTAKENIHIKLHVRIFATANDISKLPKAFLSRFLILKLSDYDMTQFIEIAKQLGKEYLQVKSTEAIEEISEEIATKLYKADIADIRQLINVMKLYNIYKGEKSVNEVLEFRGKYLL